MRGKILDFWPIAHAYTCQQDPPRPISEFSVFEKLSALNTNKAPGPDGIPSWVLKENADLLAAPVADILNSSFLERRLPTSWKKADITPLLKTSPVSDVNKHLHVRPISLTPIISKVGEEFVVDGYIKPAVLAKIDQNQYGTVPNSSTVHALISMLHNWYKDTDGNGSTVRVVLLTLGKLSILSTTPFLWLSLRIMSSHLGCWTGLQIFLLTGSNE